MRAGVNGSGGSSESGCEHPEIVHPLDPAEGFFSFQEPGSGPAQGHFGIPVAADPTGDPTHGPVGILDEVGGGETADQRRGESEPVDGKRLLEPLQETRGGIRVLALEPRRLVPETGQAFGLG